MSRTPEEMIEQLAALDAVQLGRIIAAAEAQRTAKLQQAKDALIARVREEAGALGLDPADLFARPAPAPVPARKTLKSGMRKARQVIPDKYRSPDGQHTWSGRGKTPGWLRVLEAAGQNREEFRIPQAQREASEPVGNVQGEAT